MNNTRQTKIFIGGMMLIATGTAAYAGFESHTPHTLFAIAVLALAAATSRMKVRIARYQRQYSVNLPFLLTAVVNLQRSRSGIDHLRFNRSPMLAAEGCKIQPAADDVQPEHDRVCQFTG